MPAYNASATIEKSIKSILSQSYKDLHVVVIDDGSSDDTAAIVNSIAAFDDRLELITQENSGPASARNHALDIISAKGADYIMFCDADDMFEDDYVKKLMLDKNDADIVLGGFTIVNPDGSENYYYEPDSMYSKSSFSLALPNLYKANLLNQPWAKLFKADLLKDIRFPDYRWGEDRPFVFDSLMNANKISVSSHCGYKYIMRPGESLISGYYQQKPQVCIEIDKKAQELCKHFGVEDDTWFRYMFTKSVFSCFATLYADNCDLTDSQKKRYVSLVLNNGYIQSRITPEGGSAAKAIYNAMKTRNPEINLALARTANIASDISPKLFQKIKHRK